MTSATSPATRNRTRDHLIAAKLYSQMLCQLSYSRLVAWQPTIFPAIKQRRDQEAGVCCCVLSLVHRVGQGGQLCQLSYSWLVVWQPTISPTIKQRSRSLLLCPVSRAQSRPKEGKPFCDKVLTGVLKGSWKEAENSSTHMHPLWDSNPQSSD